MAISQFDVGQSPLLIGLLGGPQVTVTNTAGATLYYDFQPNVSSTTNSGSLTAGQSLTAQEQVWVVSASRSSVNLAYLQETDAASSSTGPQIPLSPRWESEVVGAFRLEAPAAQRAARSRSTQTAVLCVSSRPGAPVTVPVRVGTRSDELGKCASSARRRINLKGTGC